MPPGLLSSVKTLQLKGVSAGLLIRALLLCKSQRMHANSADNFRCSSGLQGLQAFLSCPGTAFRTPVPVPASRQGSWECMMTPVEAGL